MQPTLAMMGAAEKLTQDITDDHLQVTLDTGDEDVEASSPASKFSGRPHHTLSETGQSLSFDKTTTRMVLKLGEDVTRQVSKCRNTAVFFWHTCLIFTKLGFFGACETCRLQTYFSTSVAVSNLISRAWAVRLQNDLLR